MGDCWTSPVLVSEVWALNLHLLTLTLLLLLCPAHLPKGDSV